MRRKPLFIGIAVAKPKSMAPLPGVFDAVDWMCQWATGNSYDIVSIDDRTKRVTVERIRSTLTPEDSEGDPDPDLLLQRPRIVVYFCGHGITDWPDQYWILSKGPDQSLERISANAFRDALASYDPRQISLISDACRTAYPVTGAGSAVLETLTGSSRNPQKDIFYSCRDGTSSYAVPATRNNSGYLVFTSVLRKALTAPDGSNLDRALLQLNRQAVTSQSLSDYLEENVPEEALGVDRIQAAQCDPGFRPLDHIYEEFAPLSGAPRDSDPDDDGHNQFEEILTGGPPPSDRDDGLAIQEYLARSFLLAERTRSRRQAFRLEQTLSDWRAPLVRRVGEMLRDLNISDEVISSVGLERARVMFPDGRRARMLDFNRGNGVSFSALPLGSHEVIESKTLCLEFGARTLALIPLFPEMHAIVVGSPVRSRQQLEFVSWISTRGDEDSPHLIHSVEALDGLTKGNLRSVDAAKLAAQIRYAKHLDPMMGIVAAYLYNAAGDIDNIHRMAYFYAYYGQPIPFDIALLGRLRLLPTDGGFITEVPEVRETSRADLDEPEFARMRTSPTEGRVAGVAPILRFGWPYMGNSSHPFHEACRKNIDWLGPSPVTTFVGRRATEDVGKAFRRFFR